MILGILFLVNLPKTMKIDLHENKFFDNWFYLNWSICFITKWFKDCIHEHLDTKQIFLA